MEEAQIGSGQAFFFGPFNATGIRILIGAILIGAMSCGLGSNIVEMGMLRRDQDGQNICKGWDVQASCGFVVDVILHFLQEG